MRPVIASVLAILALGAGQPVFSQTSHATAPAPTSVTVRGVSGAPLTLAAAALAKLHRDSIIVMHGPKKTVYEGAALGDVLRQVHAPMGAMLHGTNMTLVVLATGSDGYKAVLSLAEADPGFRHGRAIIADHVDGAPLSAREGPFRLVVEGDDHPSRNIRGLVAIDVKRVQ
jgi:DMSO/TMAO reductase YedYZ molybdopterin-dependent catalytic subunit